MVPDAMQTTTIIAFRITRGMYLLSEQTSSC